MIYFLALIPATMLTIAGYFVIYLSVRSEGSLRAFGKYLGFWAFTLAALVILGAIFAAAHGRHGGAQMRAMHGGFYGHGRGGPRFYGPAAGRRFGGGPFGRGERGTGAPPPAAAPNPAAPRAGGAASPAQ